MSRCLSDTGHDRSVPIFRALNDDRLRQIVFLAKRALELAVGAGGRNHAGSHDIFSLGTLEHPRHRRLRQAKVLCDLRLSPSLHMVHLGDP